MAKAYKVVDREQPFLLPPDLREWLPAGHLAWFVIDAVAALDTSAFHAGRRLGGVGRQGYDPDMLLALLIYCYAQKERSSRRIERLCEVDVACRVICANHVPDHTVVARFRAEHEEAFKSLFTMVVAMCVQQGAARVGTVAIDATKVHANASRLSNRTREAIEAEIDQIVAEAVEVDAAEDALFGGGRGDELPESLADPNGRVERLRRCVAELDAEQDQAVARSGTAARVERAERHLERTRAAQQAKFDAYEAAEAQGRSRPGQRVVPADEHVLTRRAAQRLAAAEAAHAKAVERAKRTRGGHRRKRNPTDPDSGMLRSQGAWVQGYNCQAAFSEDGMALAAEAIRSASDVAWLLPLIRRVQRLLEQLGSTQRIGAVLADSGYWSEDNATAYDDADAEPSPPPELLIPPKDFDRDAAGGDPPGEDADAAHKMAHRLSTDRGRATYAKRASQAEGPFGHLKTALGFTRFSRRGRAAADSEWHFILAVRNLTLLHRRGIAPATG